MRAAIVSSLFLGLAMLVTGIATHQSAWADDDEEWDDEVRHCYCCECEGCDPRFCDCDDCDCCNE